jgi:hypothetical protein
MEPTGVKPFSDELLANIRLGCKGSTETNSLTYLLGASGKNFYNVDASTLVGLSFLLQTVACVQGLLFLAPQQNGLAYS